MTEPSTERIDRLTKALEFYADPDTYFAIAVLPDRPCGDFWLDYGTHGSLDGYEPGDQRPGHLARIALGVDNLYWTPEVPITPAEYTVSDELPVSRVLGETRAEIEKQDTGDWYEETLTRMESAMRDRYPLLLSKSVGTKLVPSSVVRPLAITALAAVLETSPEKITESLEGK